MTDSDITRRRLVSALAAAGAAGLAGCGGDGTDASNVSDNEAATGTEAEGVTEGEGEELNEGAGTPERDPDNQTGDDNDTGENDSEGTPEDSDRQITVSLVNAVAGPDAVDVTVDGDSVVDGASFGEVSEAIVLGPGDHTVRLRSGDETLSEDTVTLDQGRYTGVAMGERDGERDVSFELYPVDAQVESDDEAMVRMVHAAPDAPTLDVTARGQRIFEDVEYAEASDFVTVPPREYELEIRESGASTDEPGLASFQVSLTESGVYTAVAIGHVGSSEGDSEFQVVLVRGGEGAPAEPGGETADGNETDGGAESGGDNETGDGGNETDGGNESALVSLFGGLTAL